MNVRIPLLAKWLYPSITCRIPTSEKKLFITFDDGPIPGVTPKAVEILNDYNAKATFFCVGENVEKHRDEYSLLHRNNHAVGNHTYHHLNGFKTSSGSYIKDVERASRCISSKLFRPPYGRLTPSQYSILNTHYSIIMWDVLSYDFDKEITNEQCLKNVLHFSRNGSIIVFHDSVKASDKMLHVLPQVLKHFSEEGYKFETL